MKQLSEMNAEDARAALWELLGGASAPSSDLKVEVSESEAEQGYSVECLMFMAGRRSFPATQLKPTKPNGSAVLYCHAHGNRHDIGRREVTEGRPALLDPPMGIALAEAGYAVLCPDMPGFGDRQAEGDEGALAKAALWQGRSMLGDMLRDLTLALDWLMAQGPRGVASYGLSMGATLAYWLAALDQRIAASAHFCAFSDIAPLIESGAHDLHGPYMTVPGLLRIGDMGDVAALITPRPQLVALGALDPLTPEAARDPALERLRAAYGDGSTLTVLVDEQSGHAETAEMRAAVMDFFDRSLQSAQRSHDPA